MNAQPRHWWRDNALSLVFGGLFLACLLGQSVVGTVHYNQEAQTAGVFQIAWLRYVTSSAFAVDVAENWQSEFLQFTLLILLTKRLTQRGSSESKVPTHRGPDTDVQQHVGVYAERDSPLWAKVGGWRTAIYSHSLSIVMATIFVFSWAAQALAGRVAYNEERLRDLLSPVSLREYLLSADFWLRTLQNWQSEFIAVASMAVFAVYLRERGSPESKKVGDPHRQTTSDE